MNDDEVAGRGTNKGEVLYEAFWKELAFFRADAAPPLYPTGLLTLLEEDSAELPPHCHT